MKQTILSPEEQKLIEAAALILAPLEVKLGHTVGESDLYNEVHSIANRLHALYDSMPASKRIPSGY